MEEDNLDIDTQDSVPEPVIEKPNLDTKGFGKVINTDNFPGLIPSPEDPS